FQAVDGIRYFHVTGVQTCALPILGWGLVLASSLGLFIFRGRLMMSSVSRILVGGLFIVSGMVKANDPLGFSYKLEEYFEDGALEIGRASCREVVWSAVDAG